LSNEVNNTTDPGTVQFKSRQPEERDSIPITLSKEAKDTLNINLDSTITTQNLNDSLITISSEKEQLFPLEKEV